MGKTRESEVFIRMKEALERVMGDGTLEDLYKRRDGILEPLQKRLNVGHVPEITEDEFRWFLLEKNNQHWSGLHRYEKSMCSDMDRLKRALNQLLDERAPISERLTEAIDMIDGMGKNVATAILLIAYPNKYGVWNNTSEAGLKRLGIWPLTGSGASIGDTYVKVNQVLQLLRDNLQIDFWTLDTLWWELEDV